MKRLKAATLAVGTEVTDGQITDRNSAWISNRLVLAGVEVIEHRAVPDDREKIAEALEALTTRVDLLFVTGGLGPTSDDFTRELISQVFKSPLEFHEPSWQRIVKRFEARGSVAAAIQRQQCYFPRGANILENPAGTANAFSMPVVVGQKSVFVVTLPGPPVEIAAVWDLHLADKIEALTPECEREDLYSWETLGPGESEIAEKVEEAIKGSGLRVGYRAHLPYVEVKLWVRRQDAVKLKSVLEKVEASLSYATVSKGKTDLADLVINACASGLKLEILDRLSGGYLQTRLTERLAVYRKAFPDNAMAGSLSIRTELMGSASVDLQPALEGVTQVTVESDLDTKKYLVKMPNQTLAIEPSSIYNFGTERGQKFAIEKALYLLSKTPSFKGS